MQNAFDKCCPKIAKCICPRCKMYITQYHLHRQHVGVKGPWCNNQSVEKVNFTSGSKLSAICCQAQTGKKMLTQYLLSGKVLSFKFTSYPVVNWSSWRVFTLTLLTPAFSHFYMCTTFSSSCLYVCNCASDGKSCPSTRRGRRSPNYTQAMPSGSKLIFSQNDESPIV